MDQEKKSMKSTVNNNMVNLKIVYVFAFLKIDIILLAWL